MSRLAVDVSGRGPDLVMIHGWGLHGGLWSPLVDAFRGAFRLHVVDLPGHGASHDAPLPNAELSAWAKMLLEYAPARATWVGWSLGGMMALAAALEHPAAVSRLVLIATTPRFVTASDWLHGLAPETFGEFARALETDYRATLLRFLALQAGTGETGRQTLRELRAKLDERPAASPLALQRGLALLEACDLRDALARVSQPTLVLHGSRDRLCVPEAGRELAARLPRSTLRRIDGAGHAPLISHVDVVAKHVADWLGETHA